MFPLGLTARATILRKSCSRTLNLEVKASSVVGQHARAFPAHLSQGRSFCWNVNELQPQAGAFRAAEGGMNPCACCLHRHQPNRR